MQKALAFKECIMHYAGMRNHNDIVASYGSAEELALRCGVSVNTVRSWQRRDSIPTDMWSVFVEDGKSTLEELFAGTPSRQRSSSDKAA